MILFQVYICFLSSEPVIKQILTKVHLFFSFFNELFRLGDINEISFDFESGPGSFKVYMFDTLPVELDYLPESRQGSESGITMIWNNGRLEPLLLASNGSMMAVAMNLPSAIKEEEGLNTVIDDTTFEGLIPFINQEVSGTEGNIVLDIDNINANFLVVQFTPIAGSTSTINLQITSLTIKGSGGTLYLPRSDVILNEVTIIESNELPAGLELEQELQIDSGLIKFGTNLIPPPPVPQAPPIASP